MSALCRTALLAAVGCAGALAAQPNVAQPAPAGAAEPTATAAQQTTASEASATASGARAAPPPAGDTIDVIGTTPLGAELDTSRVAGNVQTATAEQIREAGALDLADFMKRALGSVFVNDAQGNPLQPDVQYRGFVGSPLLGLPQGLAVYQDGVRVNEPFGDTVNWALIPESAIDTVSLMPGSNPLFGQNALGGALSIDTKSGFSHPGTSVEALAGSFGRVELQAETGGAAEDRLGWFVTGSYLDEDGWRDYSPTTAKQLFANVATRTDKRWLGLSVTYADTDLVGNGAAPVELLAQDRAAVFTHPDRTRNELTLLSFRGSQALSNRLALTGNVYSRSSNVRTLNSDDSDFAECTATPGFICEPTAGGEEIVRDPSGAPIPASPAVEGATVNRTSTEQDSVGLNVQATWTGEDTRRDNRLTLGLARDRSDVSFASSTELGSLDSTRLASPSGVLVGDASVDLGATIESTGVYATDTFTLAERAALTFSGRFNRTEVKLDDRLGGDLSGAHTFERFNPALGLTYMAEHALTLYAGYSEANRAPSPVELTCADPGDPCRLPNAFVADPPLKQVVAKTFEAGIRARDGSLHVGLFRTTNDDDILFVSAGALTNQGYFTNVGETRRDGLELNLAIPLGKGWHWFLDYTYLDATFRDAFTAPSPHNPAAQNGEIRVAKGDRLPLVPHNLLKAGIWIVRPRSDVGVDLVASSGSYYRGDEANLLEQLDGYAVVNVHAEFRLNDHARVLLNVDNLIDRTYETFGALGDAQRVLGPSYTDPRFVGPGAPRAAWVGVRVSF
ncbi:MAG TPA: TonB-dependent receptor [Gammaproteobacteria bacterium]|nr:TonB-dependent receptor [Gammaproteobacteria bacterium]